MGGLLGRDEQALTAALDAAKHAVARQVPDSERWAEVAHYFLALLSGDVPVERPQLPADVE